MTGKPVNLRQFRKRKAREVKAKTAEANRLEHGQPRAVTALAQARAEKSERELDGKKLSGPQTGASSDTEDPSG